MISIDNLKFHYPRGNFSLSIDRLNVANGEKLAVIGPSGTGKTTLLNLIAGITIGFVFQDFELLDYLDVMDNILHPYRISDALKLDGSVRQRAGMLATAMGIGDKINRPANDLSQGEKQRAAICRALLPQPKLILADEATGNLDPDNKIKILDLLFKAVDDHDTTLLAVTHDHELLERFDRVVDFKHFRKKGSLSPRFPK